MVADEACQAKTAVAVLATLGTWHRRSSRYTLRHLAALVRGFAPDLLCAEIDRTEWEAGRQSSLSIEYRDCLVPLCRQLAIIVVPVGDRWHGPPSPLRLALALGAGPHWVNAPAADRWHRLWSRLGRGTCQADRELLVHTAEALRRDPGRRVLVTVRMERRHAVVSLLRGLQDVTVVPPWTECPGG